MPQFDFNCPPVNLLLTFRTPLLRTPLKGCFCLVDEIFKKRIRISQKESKLTINNRHYRNPFQNNRLPLKISGHKTRY